MTVEEDEDFIPENDRKMFFKRMANTYDLLSKSKNLVKETVVVEDKPDLYKFLRPRSQTPLPSLILNDLIVNQCNKSNERLRSKPRKENNKTSHIVSDFDKEKPLSLASVSTCGVFKQTPKIYWPLLTKSADIPFQEYSEPSSFEKHFKSKVAKKENRSDDKPKEESIKIDLKSFNAMENCISNAVKGLNSLTAIQLGLLDNVLQRDENGWKINTDATTDQVSSLASSSVSALEGLAVSLTHTRTQLASLYRDKFLEHTALETHEKSQLRSTPLCKNSLFEVSWVEETEKRHKSRLKSDRLYALSNSQKHMSNQALRGRGVSSRGRLISRQRDDRPNFNTLHNQPQNHIPQRLHSRGSHQRGSRGSGRGIRRPPQQREPPSFL